MIPSLRAMTPEARAALQTNEVSLHRLPFRVGRECRVCMVEGVPVVTERRKPSPKPSNDLYLIEPGKELNVSRKHFQIEEKVDGGYELVDTGSACGTIVDGQPIGGQDRGGRYNLKEDSVIIVGTSNSRLVFRFVLSPAAAAVDLEGAKGTGVEPAGAPAGKVPVLLAITPQARIALQTDEIQLDKFPFGIGRERRIDFANGAVVIQEHRKHDSIPNNDRYLIDRSPEVHISREHFQIEKKEDGTYEVVDRGSTCGTLVGNRIVGGENKGGRCPLKEGDEIVAGTAKSPFRFKFLIPGE